MQSTHSGSRKTSSRETNPLGSMARFAAVTAARTKQPRELILSPKRVGKATTSASGKSQVAQEQGRKDW